MKSKILLSFLIFFAAASFAQTNKDLSISLSAGILNSPYYTNAKGRPFYNVDFTYHITNRHALSTSFLGGKFFYFDSLRSNNSVSLSTPGYEKNRNAKMDNFAFSILYKYKIVNGKRVSINTGIGIGLLTEVSLFPYTEGNSVSFRQSSSTDLVFPLRLDVEYKVSKFFQIGLINGLFINPDFPILGYHTGFRISYLLK